MKKLFTLLLFITLAAVSYSQERFLDEVFEGVTETDTMGYGLNTTVLTVLDPTIGVPIKRPLFFNFYEPEGDTMEERPLVILFHTGNFLPSILNGQVSGTLKDTYIVDLSRRLAKMGYCVAVIDYRKGWNPLSDVQEVRTNTLINAAYRGVQDSRTAAKFFRATALAQGNPYRIDPAKIVAWGVGTGGYISLATATLDNASDIILPKFIGSNGLPMVLESVNGDISADSVGINPITGDTLCHPNFSGLGLSSEFQLAVNMGGAMGDTSWMDANDPPIISFHVPSDPSAPYEEDLLVVPTTGDLVVEVQGSYLIQQKANELGINDVFKNNVTFDDPFTQVANSRNDGYEGLFPVPRQDWPNAAGELEAVESGPWETWDADFWSQVQPQQCIDAGLPVEQCNWHLVSLRGNPDMSYEKGTAYLDTVLGYYGPRACVALDLPCASNFINDNVEDNELASSLLSAFPNPASRFVEITANGNEAIKAIRVYDLNGRVVREINLVENFTYRLDVSDITDGMHIVRAYFEEGVVTKKVMIQK